MNTPRKRLVFASAVAFLLFTASEAAQHLPRTRLLLPDTCDMEMGFKEASRRVMGEGTYMDIVCTKAQDMVEYASRLDAITDLPGMWDVKIGLNENGYSCASQLSLIYTGYFWGGNNLHLAVDEKLGGDPEAVGGLVALMADTPLTFPAQVMLHVCDEARNRQASAKFVLKKGKQFDLEGFFAGSATSRAALEQGVALFAEALAAQGFTVEALPPAHIAAGVPGRG